MDSTRKSKVGTIEVVRYGAAFLRWDYLTTKDVDFNQANKKDTQSITGGQYTMSTTKKGRLICPKNRERFCDIWSIGGKLGRLAVKYRMSYTLQVRYILRTIVNLHGTYWYNARNILVVYSCVGMDLTVLSFRPRGSFFGCL